MHKRKSYVCDRLKECFYVNNDNGGVRHFLFYIIHQKVLMQITQCDCEHVL